MGDALPIEKCGKTDSRTERNTKKQRQRSTDKMGTCDIDLRIIDVKQSSLCKTSICFKHWCHKCPAVYVSSCMSVHINAWNSML